MRLISVLLAMCTALACQGAHHRSPEKVALPGNGPVIVEVKLSYDAANYITQDEAYALLTNRLTHSGVRITPEPTTGSQHFRVNVEVLRIAQGIALLILEAECAMYAELRSQDKNAHPARCIAWEHERALTMSETELKMNLRVGLCGVAAQFKSEYFDGHKGVFEDCGE